MDSHDREWRLETGTVEVGTDTKNERSYQMWGLGLQIVGEDGGCTEDNHSTSEGGKIPVVWGGRKLEGLQKVMATWDGYNRLSLLHMFKINCCTYLTRDT